MSIISGWNICAIAVVTTTVHAPVSEVPGNVVGAARSCRAMADR